MGLQMQVDSSPAGCHFTPHLPGAAPLHILNGWAPVHPASWPTLRLQMEAQSMAYTGTQILEG